MSHQDDTIPIDPSERPARSDARPSLDAPNFDARSVSRARAAVPLDRGGGGWDGKLPWVVVAVVAGMIGGLLGIWTLNRYQSADDGVRAATESAATTAAQSAAQPRAQADAAASKSRANGAEEQPAPADAAPGDGTGAAGAAEAPADATPVSGGEAEELRGALSDWIGATNSRDIDRQMSFYESRVGTYYLSRDVSRQAVRAEKSAAFSRATKVDVRAEEPQIFLGRDGRTATMRFRKRYSIEGGAGGDRSGAVLQELRWRRMPQGWRIVGERDLRVVN
jgi:ketosteroid isomerase-like protein